MKKENQIAVVKNTLAIRKVENLLSITEKLLKKEFSHCIYISYERVQIARLDNNNVYILSSDTLREYVPTAVSFNKKGVCLVGDSALNRWKIDEFKYTNTKSNSCIDFIRNLGTEQIYRFENTDKEYTSTALLVEFLKFICSLDGLFDSITNSIIVIPNDFNSNQISDLRKASNLIGLSNITLIREAIATKRFYIDNISAKIDFSVVLSIYKTSSNITLTKNNKIVDTETNNFWGGNDIDYLIVDKMFIPYLKNNFTIDSLVNNKRSLNRLRSTLQWHAYDTKIRLSYGDEKTEVLTALGDLGNDDNNEDMEIDLVITVNDLSAVLINDFQNLILRVKEVINRNNLSIDNLSEIYLNDINTRLPILGKLLSDNLVEPKISEENRNAAIIGGTLLLNEINTAGNNVYSA